MSLHVLALTGFRNYSQMDLVCHSGINLVVGPNGHGKSNLLEAIITLSVGKSARRASDMSIVQWGAPGYTVAGRIGTEDSPSVVDLSYRRGEGKVYRVDGQRVRPLSEMVGRLRTVAVSPEAIEGECKPSGGRRRALDRFIAQCDTEYLSLLKAYQRAVAQINSALKAQRLDDALLEAGEKTVAELSVSLTRHRLRMLERLNTTLGHGYSKIARTTADIRLTMETAVEDIDKDSATEQLAKRLKSQRRQSAKAGYILSGAHRERVDLLMDGRHVEQYASQGQLKLAFISWRLAEAEVLAQISDEPPTLVLDDPFSELDRERSLRLLEAFREWGQIFVATARDTDLPLDSDQFGRIEVRDGHAERVA